MDRLPFWVWWAILQAALVTVYLVWGPVFAHAADMKQCAQLANDVREVVEAATGDTDLMQYLHDRAYSHCVLSDELPIRIELTPLDQMGTVPATGTPIEDKAKPTPKSDQDRWCEKHFKSYHPDDGTVIVKRHKPRVPCPYQP